MRRTFLLAAALFAMVQPISAPLANTTGSVPRLSTSGSFTAPVGFQIFCLTNRSHCRGGGAEQVRLTQAVLSTLQSVNAQVNRSISPSNDRQDVWSLGVTRGDCEDFVLAKRAALIRAGLPASALRIAAATTRSGIGHAVLIVRTNEGDLVLDNLNGAVKLINQTSLRWVAMTLADGRSWRRIA